MKVKMIPIRDLKNTSEISELCETEQAPIYVTKNGKEHLVIMTQAIFERIAGQAEIINRQKSAIRSAKAKQGVDSDEVFAMLEKNYGK
jgi:PHD/YefM family antitoxin component YafN of YafNO toxin-antitoxin module